MPPESQHIVGLPDLELHSTDYKDNIYVHATLKKKPNCPRCQNAKVRIKSSFKRRIRHTRIGNQIVIVCFKSHKYFCNTCNLYFNLKLQGLLPKRRSTEAYRLDVFERHQGGVSQKQLAITHRISHATVERWYQEFIQNRVKELSGRKAPIVLGIDEHFFTRKKGYATTFVDLKNHKVFDVVLGRSEASLEGLFKEALK